MCRRCWTVWGNDDMNSGTVIFDPLLPLVFIVIAAALIGAALALALWRRGIAVGLRALAAAALLLALVNPSWQQEQKRALDDIVLVVVDESASQSLSDRSSQSAAALAQLERDVAQLGDTELRVMRLGDGAGDSGTLVMDVLQRALAEVPRARVAGAFVITDGEVHDLERTPDMPAPLHVLQSGRKGDWDRRLLIKNAPAFAILNEEVILTLRIEDQGEVPAALQGFPAEVSIAIDGGAPQTFTLPVGRDIELPLTLPHGGMNVMQFTVAEAAGELTTRNNSAVVQINGVRDRLRVLLVSGEPYAGERTWRNLLKSDSAVDLVHFTILRPPEKQDGVPVSELSLIAFPTRELFMDKIDDFDLIVFDRYKLRGILPGLYLANVANYVRKGGAVLVAAGPDFASASSLARSPLGEVLPGEPTGRVIDQAFAPAISDLGQRHPVTRGLDAASEGDWGRWMRMVELEPRDDAQVVMRGAEDAPLLLLGRQGLGRVALLASDQAWLWSRGFEGGGPQLDLLRRLAHWMMKEPELEEEALGAVAQGQSMRITRRSLEARDREVEITGPDGVVTVLPMEEVTPGLYESRFEAPVAGLYRLREGEEAAVVALGPSAPKEFEVTISDGSEIAAAVAASGGALRRIEDRLPALRRVRPGRVAAGRGWLGITPRGASVTEDIRVTPVLPPWAWLLLAVLLMLAAWLWEGRRDRRHVGRGARA